MQIKRTNSDSNVNVLYNREFNNLQRNPPLLRAEETEMEGELRSYGMSVQHFRRGPNRDPAITLRKLKIAKLIRLWREVEKDLLRDFFDDDNGDDDSIFLPYECSPFCACNKAKNIFKSKSSGPVPKLPNKRISGDVVLHLKPLKNEPNSRSEQQQQNKNGAVYESPPIVTMTPDEVNELERNLHKLDFSEKRNKRPVPLPPRPMERDSEFMDFQYWNRN